MEGAEVTIVHRGGSTKKVTLIGFDDPKRPIVLLKFPMSGHYRASLNHGWLEAPCEDWRIAYWQLDALRAWANEQEHWVTVTDRPRGRLAVTRAAPANPKQGRLGGIE